MPETKKCTTCGEVKDRALFHRRADRPIGVTPSCSACKAKKAAEYRKRNVEQCKARSLDWYYRNREHSIATTRAWQKANQ